MADPISSRHYLDNYLTARAERAEKLQTELNDLRVENKFLRAMLAEERMKNGELKASTEARISYFKSLIDPMATSMRTDDALGKEITTDQRKRRRVDDSDAISISDEAEEEPAQSSESRTVVRTPRPSQDTSRQKTPTSRGSGPFSYQRKGIQAPTTPLELSRNKQPNSSRSTRDDTGSNSNNIPSLIIHQRDNEGHNRARAPHARNKSARVTWDHHWQLPPLCPSIISHRFSRPNHKFTNLAIPPAANGLFPPVGDFNIFSNLSVMKTSDFESLRVNELYHPHAPTNPGGFGVLFGGPEYKTGSVELVVREEVGMWRYFGVYRMIKLERVDRAEWNAVNKDVRWKWARYFASHLTGSDLSSCAAAARDLSREPNEIDIEDLRKFGRASADEIMTEWNRGRALPFAWGLQCVGYNEAYHNEAHRAVKRWEKRKSRDN